MFSEISLSCSQYCSWLSRSELGAKVKGKDELNVAVVIFVLLWSFRYFFGFNSLCCLAVPYSAMWEAAHPWSTDDDESDDGGVKKSKADGVRRSSIFMTHFVTCPLNGAQDCAFHHAQRF